jgi:hypothetical protein
MNNVVKLVPASEPSEVEQQDGNTVLSFRKWRRRTVEQIMSRKDLSPSARLTAYSIAERLHGDARSTPSSSMTLGRPVGLKPSEAQNGLVELVAAGHVRIKRRGESGRDLLLSERSDIGSPYIPVLAPSAFFKTPEYFKFLTRRAKFLDKVFADERLSPADKVIAFAATRFIEVERGTIEQTFEAIGRAVGYGAAAVRRSAGRLVAAGYFSKNRAPGRMALLTPAMDSATDSATVKSQNHCGAGTSSPISYFLSDSPRRKQELDSSYLDSVCDSMGGHDPEPEPDPNERVAA